MNVIIRLQNLPWSASALDIRNFFKGLQIPEGGVHIVGGENGDAFIAFSSDEDARQAMMRNNTELKNVQVKLNLSSRSEMQKVIELARNSQVLAATAPVVAPSIAAATSIPTAIATIPTVVPQLQTSAVPKPVDAAALQSLYSLYAAQLQAQMAASTSPAQLAAANEQLLKYLTQAGMLLPTVTSTTSSTPAISNFTTASDMEGSKNAEIDATKRDTQGSLRDKHRSSRNSRSPDRYDKNSRSRSRSRSNDRFSNRRRYDRSHSRERDRNKRSRSRDRYGRDSRERYRRSSSREKDRPAFVTRDYKTFSNGSNAKQSNDVWETSSNNFNGSSKNAVSSTEIEKLREIERNRNPAAFQTKDDNEARAESELGHSIRISNVDSSVYYSDIRRYFFGLAIGQNDIKIMNDEHGNRTGEVLVRFLSTESKKIALQKNMSLLKKSWITIHAITDMEFHNAVDRYKPYQSSGWSTQNSDSKKTVDDTSKIKSPEEFWGEDAYDDDSSKYDAEKFYTYLMVDDLPKHVTLEDIKRAFPKAVEVVLNKYSAFLRFPNHPEAKRALEDRYGHYISNKRVFLSNSDADEFNKNHKHIIWNTHNQSKFYYCANEVPRQEEIPVIILDDIDDNSQSIKSNGLSKTGLQTKNPPSLLDLNFTSNGSSDLDSNIKSDCVVMRNLDNSTTDADVVVFFRKANLKPVKVHILLDKSGKPSGDCFCEFKDTNEAQEALQLDNFSMGTSNNIVRIELIPRIRVENILNSFNNGSNSKSVQIFTSHDEKSSDSTQNSQQQSNGEDNILYITNVPYRCTVDQILDEFQEFDLTPKQVSRRIDSRGLPSGAIWIKFNNREDMMKAYQTKNMAIIQGRKIYVKIFNPMQSRDKPNFW